MCEQCWIELGNPTDLPPNAPAIIADIRELYGYYPAGGYLHVELDDWNIGDGFWKPDFDGAARWADEGMSESEVSAAHAVTLRVAGAMAALTESGRAAVLAACEGFVL